VSERVAYARELVAAGHRPAVVARILRISRQAIYRIPRRRPAPASRARTPADEVEAAIVEVAEANPTDGYRLVTAWVRRRLGRRVNRERMLRVMRERRLIQCAAARCRVGAGRGSSASSGPINSGIWT
jgi:putative transposase